jgi:excinuclease ABC subunit C
MNTATQALSTRLVEAASMDERLLELQRALDLDTPPRRLECFDISHTGGEKAVASCVVFNEAGPLKSAYRKFNIDGITPGDDYAAIKQAVARRFARVKSGEAQAPDVLFIDGGLGQLNAALEALEELEIGELRVVGIAKGPTRRPGLEELIVAERELPLSLSPDSPALHLIQRIRDEAHRFAITGHRGRRDKARLSSGLEAIEGLGPARRRALLKAFGGLAQIKRANVDELARVEGVSRTLAERVYAYFH